MGSVLKTMIIDLGPAFRLGTLALTLALVAVIAEPTGARAQETGQQFLEDARERLEDNDPLAAEIQLRNALDRDPDLVEAQRLLTELYLTPQSLRLFGQRALRRQELAEELYQMEPSDAHQILLARALLSAPDPSQRESNFEDVLSVVDPAAETEELEVVKAQLLGNAHFGLEQLDEARAQYTRALELNPRASQAYIALARVANAQDDKEEALEHIYSALDIDPSNLQAWLARAELLTDLNRPGDALLALDQALEISPDNAAVLARKARLSLRTGDLEEARATIDEAIAANPDNIDARYTNITILIQEGRFEEADREFTQIEDTLRNFEPALLLGGIIRINTERYALAEDLLASYVARNPNNIAAQHLLADTYLRRDDQIGAIEVLEPILRREPDDIGTLRRLASAYTRQGDIAKAAEYYERIRQQPSARASQQAARRLALINNAMGGATGGGGAAAEEADPVAATILLVQDFIEAGQIEEAQEALDRELANSPDNVLLRTLQAEVALVREDLPAARDTYDSILRDNPDFLPALQGLARVVSRIDGPDAAQETLFEAMERAPNNEAIVLGTARFLASRDDIEDGAEQAAQLLETKITEIPDSPRLKATLARFYVEQDRDEDAARIARELYALVDTAESDEQKAVILDLSGRLLVDAGEAELGLEALEQLTELRPDDVDPVITLARAHFVNGNREQGREWLLRARDLQPENRQVAIALVDLAIENDEEAEAIAVAERLGEADPVGGALVRSRVFVRQDQLDEAVTYLRRANAELQSTEIALTIFNALREDGQESEAAESLTDWVVANPQDDNAKRVLSSFLLNRGNLGEAAELYERIIDAAPNDAISLNNLAWILGEQEEYDRAIVMARRALQLAPNSPEIADTVGWLLIRNGQFNEGIRLVEAATRARPENGDMAYHLAYGLFMTGKRDEARDILVSLIDTEQDFSRRGEAEALLEQVGR